MAYTRVSTTAQPIYAAPLGAVGEQFKGWLTAGALIGVAFFAMKYLGPGRKRKA